MLWAVIRDFQRRGEIALTDLAAGHAQVLSQLDFPAHSRDDDDVLSEDDVELLDAKNLRSPQTDPRPVSPPLSPRAEQIALVPPTGGR